MHTHTHTHTHTHQDPTTGLLQLAEQRGMGERFQALSLGQGQAPIAKRMIENGTKEVRWDCGTDVETTYVAVSDHLCAMQYGCEVQCLAPS